MSSFYSQFVHISHTIPEHSLKRWHSKRKRIFQPSIFIGYSFSEAFKSLQSTRFYVKLPKSKHLPLCRETLTEASPSHQQNTTTRRPEDKLYTMDLPPHPVKVANEGLYKLRTKYVIILVVTGIGGATQLVLTPKLPKHRNVVEPWS